MVAEQYMLRSRYYSNIVSCKKENSSFHVVKIEQVPISDRNEMLLSTIKEGDSRADLISQTSTIIWDEAPMANQAVLTCVDETLRRITHSTTPFGGKSLILSGDFRQTGPVVPYGSKQQVIDASIKSSPLWHLFHKITLHRLIRNASDPEFADFVNKIGEGVDDFVSFDGFNIVESAEEIMDYVYPTSMINNPQETVECSILAPTNKQVDAYNDAILNRIEGDERVCVAADTLKEVDEAGLTPTTSALDYVMRNTPPGLPMHRLRVKIGGVYRLLRNLSQERGLVKNVRVVIVAATARLVTVRLLNPLEENPVQYVNTDQAILLPRITFEAKLKSGHTLLRRQFPLAPAYATTFNGCQGLTLKRIGVDVIIPVFSHGQLYTAISRVRTRNDVMIRLGEGESQTKNVTFREILD